MTRKRLVKLLMGEGYGRNEANDIADTRHDSLLGYRLSWEAFKTRPKFFPSDFGSGNPLNSLYETQYEKPPSPIPAYQESNKWTKLDWYALDVLLKRATRFDLERIGLSSYIELREWGNRHYPHREDPLAIVIKYGCGRERLVEKILKLEIQGNEAHKWANFMGDYKKVGNL